MSQLTLEIVEGPGAGRQVQLSGPIEVGRDPDADLHVEDDLVSRRHVRVTPDGDGAIVEDLNSLNGTFVNDDEIHVPTRVKPGEDILIGVIVLELRSAGQVASQPTAIRPRPPALAIPARQPDYVPPSVAGKPAAPDTSDLDPLLDIYTKSKARTAPLAVFVIVIFAVLIFLATR